MYTSKCTCVCICLLFEVSRSSLKTTIVGEDTLVITFITDYLLVYLFTGSLVPSRAGLVYPTNN